MKKILLLGLVLVASLTSCKSNEEKVAELIDKNMFENLFDHSSYEPIETIVKEGVSTIYTDSLIRKYAVMAQAASKLSSSALKKVDNALDYANIYAGSYSYSSRQKYDDYMAEVDREQANVKKYMGIWEAYEDSIKLRAADFSPQKIGWEVAHKFRCKNKGGNFSLGNYIYIIDAKFKTIIDEFDVESQDEIDLRKRIDLATKED